MAAAKDPQREMKVYDVFGMIPEPSERDGQDVLDRYEKISAGESRGIRGETYYGYRQDLLGEVTESFTPARRRTREPRRRAGPGPVPGHHRPGPAGGAGPPRRGLVRLDHGLPRADRSAVGSGRAVWCSTTTTSGPAAAKRPTTTSRTARASGSNTARSCTWCVRRPAAERAVRTARAAQPSSMLVYAGARDVNASRAAAPPTNSAVAQMSAQSRLGPCTDVEPGRPTIRRPAGS